MFYTCKNCLGFLFLDVLWWQITWLPDQTTQKSFLEYKCTLLEIIKQLEKNNIVFLSHLCRILMCVAHTKEKMLPGRILLSLAMEIILQITGAFLKCDPYHKREV